MKKVKVLKRLPKSKPVKPQTTSRAKVQKVDKAKEDYTRFYDDIKIPTHGKNEW